MLLFLSACAHYQQPVYNRYSGPYPAYGNGYVIRENNYYGTYPYRYNNNAHTGYGNYGHDDHHYERHHHNDDHKEHGHRNKPGLRGVLKPNPPNGHRHHPYSRKKELFAIDDRVYGSPGRKLYEVNDRNYKRDNLYLVERKKNKDKPDRSSQNRLKHEQNHRE